MALSKKQIMEMNKKWKDFRLQEYKLFKPGFQHGFDLSEFKPGGFKKMLKALNIPTIAKGSHQGGSDFSNGFGGSDMFMSNMPTPTKTVKSVVTASSNSPDSVLTPPEPPASSTEKKEETVPVVAVDTGFGGFSFSMDEDF